MEFCKDSTLDRSFTYPAQVLENTQLLIN